MCKAIDDPRTGNDVFAKLYGAASVYYNYSGAAECFRLNGDSDPHGLNEWDWQVNIIFTLFFSYLLNHLLSLIFSSIHYQTAKSNRFLQPKICHQHNS